MLGLKLATDPRWVNIAESNIAEILTDHAYCEQKAASNAISIIVNFPEHADMVRMMVDIAREELEHFKMVHDRILERGLQLGRERKDDYVNELMKFVRKGEGRLVHLVDRLLFAAMIEARSCERFRLLSQHVSDPQLATFYHELMVSEANHYTVFIGFARQYGQDIDVESRWQDFLRYEAEVIASYGKRGTIHG
jgi:tRNA-(ms[2]io[6]A)-hydroxylase